MSEQDHNSYSASVELILIGMASISSLISLLIPALYHIKNQCRQHPTSLISKISLLQALSNYNVILLAVNIYKFQQYIDITNIFDIITFNQPQQPSETQFCEINYTLYMLLELSSIAYNICFSIDLLWTLKYPFYAGRKRMKFYNLFVLLFLIATMPQAMGQAYDICENQFHLKSIYKIPLIFIIALGIFFITSILIIAYSYLKMKEIGAISAKYIQHHRVILFVLLLCWVCPLYTNILIYNGDKTSELFYIVNLIAFISLLLLGAIVNIVRFYHDSYLWERIKKMVLFHSIRKYQRKIKNKSNLHQDKLLEQNDIWNVPLATAVQQLNSQKIIHSLIQVVVEVCSESQTKKIDKNDDITGRSQSIAILPTQQKQILQSLHLRKTILHKSEFQNHLIETNIVTATEEQLRKICKKTKKFNMICINDDERVTSPNQQNLGNLRMKTVFNPSKQNRQKTEQIISDQRKRTTSQINIHKSLLIGPQRRKTSLKDVSLSSPIQVSDKSAFLQMRKNKIQMKVSSFGHKIFESIRKLNGMDQEQLKESLNLEKNVDNIMKAKESLGASGSFFFFSWDKKIIIKTIAEGEDHSLINILPLYYRHFIKYKHSLLSKIFGLFTVQIAGISKITFILMQNTFQRMQIQNIEFRRYDLKGSTVKRQVTDPKAAVLKDINYLKSNDAFIMMNKQARDQLIQQIELDIKLLKSQNIMDYSLLLGVGVRKSSVNMDNFLGQEQHLRRTNSQKQKLDQMNFQKDILKRKSHVTFDINNLKNIKIKSSVLDKPKKQFQQSWKYVDDFQDISGKIYSISIIDYLQEFNFNKYMELKLKQLFKGGGDISSVDSEFYFDRFLNFIKKITIPVVNYTKKGTNKNWRFKQVSLKTQSLFVKNKKQTREIRKTVFQLKIDQKWQSLYEKLEQ